MSKSKSKFLLEKFDEKIGDFEYFIDKKSFVSFAKAIDHAFKRFSKENINVLRIEKVKKIEPTGFMKAIKFETVGTMVIKGPSGYKIEAMQQGF